MSYIIAIALLFEHQKPSFAQSGKGI